LQNIALLEDHHAMMFYHIIVHHAKQVDDDIDQHMQQQLIILHNHVIQSHVKLFDYQIIQYVKYVLQHHLLYIDEDQLKIQMHQQSRNEMKKNIIEIFYNTIQKRRFYRQESSIVIEGIVQKNER